MLPSYRTSGQHLRYHLEQLKQIYGEGDRLLRFGTELVFLFCRYFGVKVVLLEEAKPKSFEEELVADVIELMTIFSSRIYGKRSHKNKNYEQKVA